MNEPKHNLVKVEKWFYLSLTEVTTSFGISAETVMNIVEEGIISPQKNENNEWQFDDEAVRCIRTVLCLNRDLGVNYAGAGLAIELLKEIDHLRAQLRNNRDSN